MLVKEAITRGASTIKFRQSDAAEKGIAGPYFASGRIAASANSGCLTSYRTARCGDLPMTQSMRP